MTMQELYLHLDVHIWQIYSLADHFHQVIVDIIQTNYAYDPTNRVAQAHAISQYQTMSPPPTFTIHAPLTCIAGTLF